MNKCDSFFSLESFSYYISTYYTASNNLISSANWNKVIYKKLSQTESLLNCFAQCYFEETCKIVVFKEPFCFLGDPFFNGTLVFEIANKTVYGNYGLFSKSLTLIHHI